MTIQKLSHAKDGERQSMQRVLLLTATAEASDPRDRIFALGSMSSGTLAEALLPRYDLPVSQIFLRATRYMISYDKHILVLHMAGIGWTRSHKDLPSWVPDYSLPRYDQKVKGENFILGRLAERRPTLYAAGSNYTSDEPAKVVTWSWAPQFLSLHGVVVDKVRRVYRGPPLTGSIWNIISAGTYIERKEILSWYNNTKKLIYGSQSSDFPYLNGKDRDASCLLDAFRQTLVAGNDCDRFTGLAGRSPHGYFDAFSSFLLHTVSSRDDDPRLNLLNDEQLKEARSYIRALEQVSDWSTFCTSQGYIGRGPPLLQEGDYICIFQGGRTPFVIRAGSFEGFGLFRLYRLVGECYVQGLMSKKARLMNPWRWGPIVLH
ncbi:MAG: hypothetical protein Q9222_004885 [Ikaeria aurantiellina]